MGCIFCLHARRKALVEKLEKQLEELYATRGDLDAKLGIIHTDMEGDVMAGHQSAYMACATEKERLLKRKGIVVHRIGNIEGKLASIQDSEMNRSLLRDTKEANAIFSLETPKHILLPLAQEEEARFGDFKIEQNEIVSKTIMGKQFIPSKKYPRVSTN